MTFMSGSYIRDCSLKNSVSHSVGTNTGRLMM